MSYVVPSGTTRAFGGERTKPIRDVTQIQDPRISREHFRISNVGGQIRLTDGSASGKPSTNGTLINGQRVTDQIIDDGTVFSAGETQFQVRWEHRPEDSDRKVVPPPIVEPTIDGPALVKPDDVPLSVSISISSSSSGLPPASESSVVDPKLPMPFPLRETQEFPVIDAQGISNGASQDDRFPNQSPVIPRPSDDGSIDRSDLFGPVVRLIRHTTSLFMDFERIVRELLDSQEGFLIAHFAKLSNPPPLNRVGIPMYPHLDPAGRVLPIAIDKSDWFSSLHDDYAERLFAVDGWMAAVSTSTMEEAQDSILEMGRSAVPGFSEQDGFVPWCWPSSAGTVLQNLSDAQIGQWMGPRITGLVFPEGGRILAYARPEAMSAFYRHGFS
jgi:pSer/pThr/pTyr-binding forkhead associated (FHA) protein